MFSIEIRIIFLFLFVNSIESLRCHVAYPLNCIYNSTCSYRSIECQQSSSPSLNRGGMYCTTIIKKEDEQFLIGRMDCMYDQETTKTCLNQSQCFMKYTNDQKQFLHCCCDQHLCNLNFNLSNPEPVQIPSNEYRTNLCQNRFCKKMYLFIGLIVGLCFVICLIFFGLFCRKNFIGNFKKCRKTHENHQVEIDPLINDQFQIDSNQIQIINLYKKGRFSYLEKGFYQNQEIILKTFSNDRQSDSLFENEKTIYSLISNEKHKNILQYFGFTKSPINRLIFEYCRNGSLKDYLIGNQIENEIDLLLMLKDLSEGLHYLHRDYRNEYPRRAPIAHRDFKSENILFFHFNRLVICDFAMSTQIQQYQYGLNNQQQMGTPRYMSPEILVGTIGCDEGSLLKCDVYALGIVFWEILSRFNFQNSHVNKSYEFPFEIQLKENHFNVNNPTVKEMNIIIELSPPLNRPLIDSNWNNSKMKSFHSIISIINECWNQNPELRITAGVVFSRINKIFEEISSI